MKIKCSKQPLLKALQSVTAIATQKDLYPVLENVKIVARDNTISLQATDLKISLTYLLQEQITIIEPGEMLICAAKLYNLVKETPDAEISLEQDNLNGVLVCQDGKFCIWGEDTSKFPEIPKFQDQAALEIGGEDFQTLIKKTLFATTTEKTRYDLDNVLITVNEDKLRFVATDGKRLALCEKKCKIVGDVPKKPVTVPNKGLQQIEKVLTTTSPATVTLNFLENQLLFRTNEITLSTRLSDAKFPPYEKVIPKGLAHKITLVTKDFASALRRVCILADEKNKIVEVSLTAKSMKLFAMGEGTGEATLEMPIEFTGEPFTIKFNPNFLLDVAKVVVSENLEVLLQDSSSAVLIKDGEDFQYILLPIKVEDKRETAQAEDTGKKAEEKPKRTGGKAKRKAEDEGMAEEV